MKQTNEFYHTKPLTVKIGRTVEPNKIKIVRKTWNSLKKEERELVRILEIKNKDTRRSGHWNRKGKKIRIWVNELNKKYIESILYHEIGHAIFDNKKSSDKIKFLHEISFLHPPLTWANYRIYKKLLKEVLIYFRKVDNNKSTITAEAKMEIFCKALANETFSEMHAYSNGKKSKKSNFSYVRYFPQVLQSYKKLMRKKEHYHDWF